MIFNINSKYIHTFNFTRISGWQRHKLLYRTTTIKHQFQIRKNMYKFVYFIYVSTRREQNLISSDFKNLKMKTYIIISRFVFKIHKIIQNYSTRRKRQTENFVYNIQTCINFSFKMTHLGAPAVF